MKCLRSLVGVSIELGMKRVRRRAGIEWELASRAEQIIEMVWACGKN